MFGATPGRPFRATAGGGAVDMYDSTSATAFGVLLGAKLTAAAANATCQLVDADGTVLWEGAAPVNGADWLDVPVIFRGKVRVTSIVGVGCTLIIYVE